jgi:PPOX class probable F420-dependent enzyme
MKLTSHLSDDRRAHVEGRLRANLMAWLTTVRPDGRPDSVPVWFLVTEDETILIYSQPGKVKLRNISHNPRVALGLDVTDRPGHHPHRGDRRARSRIPCS